MININYSMSYPPSDTLSDPQDSDITRQFSWYQIGILDIPYSPS